MLMILHGTPFVGFHIAGPFRNYDHAHAWGEANFSINGPSYGWWILRATAPKEKENENI